MEDHSDTFPPVGAWQTATFAVCHPIKFAQSLWRMFAEAAHWQNRSFLEPRHARGFSFYDLR